jgi:hypothetical protein
MKDFLSSFATPVITILQFLVTGGLWAMRKSFATQEQLAKLRDREEARDRRVHALELARETAPTANDVTELRIGMAGVSGAVNTLSAKLDGSDSLLTRQERLVAVLLEHQINRGT